MPAARLVGTFGSHAFLEGLSERHLLKLASGAQPFTAAVGEYLAREGEPSHAFFLIQAGRVTLGPEAPGLGLVPLQTLGPGEVVGWSWLVPPHRWQFDCRAIEPVRGIFFHAEWLREQCEEDHELGYQIVNHLLSVVAGRLAATRGRLMDSLA